MEIIIKILRFRKDIRTKNEEKLSLFLHAVFYVLISGIQWRLLPLQFGRWRSVHKRFSCWSKKGIWKNVFKACQIEPDFEYVMVDSTVVRVHACASGIEKDGNKKHAIGRSKGGLTTKIHALCDALGNPLKFILTAGNKSDITKAAELIQFVYDTKILGDKGYDSDKFIETIENQRSQAIIPPRRNRKYKRIYDKHLYKERHLTPCFFGKIKHFRRIFSRFDKAIISFMSFLHLAGALIWLR